MKRFFIFLLVICVYSAVNAQQLTVKSVNLRPQDARARTNPRNDSNGKKCAIIRVGVVGVEDMAFPDAVGEVERSLSEYVVYVPDGLKSFRYKNKSSQNFGTIVFDDYDLEINSMASYDVIFESVNHLRSAVFTIQPKNAQLVFNGEKVNVDKEGIAIINKPVGEYSYQITADGFEGQSGTVSLTEDDISTVTNVILQEILYPVKIHTSPENAVVFIDNVPYSKEVRRNLQLPGGKHSFRVTASNYKDEERTINVKSGLSPIYFTLKENEQEIVKHKEERTRTNINIRNALYITANFTTAGMSNVSKTFSSELRTAIKSKNAWIIGVELSAIQHLGGMFGVREAIGLALSEPQNNEKYVKHTSCNDSTYMSIFLDVPLQLGMSLPFGKYNQHVFNVFGGGYFSGFFSGGAADAIRALSNEEKQMIDNKTKKTNTYLDYGIRISGKLDLWHFTMGIDISKSFHDMGFAVGANIGIKLYTKNDFSRKKLFRN